jgi:DNA replication protein DnaC
MSTNHQELLNNFEALGLKKTQEYFPNYLEIVNRKGIPFTEALLELTRTELAFKHQCKIDRMIRNARFPTTKRLTDFDFAFQPSIDKHEITDLGSLGFLDSAHNICFLGNSGVGKTHLAISLGVEACNQGIKSKFIVFHDLVTRFTDAYAKGTLPRMMKKFANIPLLIIDEIGYVPITHEQADWFYQLMSERYERHSTIITTNIQFSMWAKLFNNDTVSAAILDRLIHHSKVFKITGNSYRLKDYHEEKLSNITSDKNSDIYDGKSSSAVIPDR